MIYMYSYKDLVNNRLISLRNTIISAKNSTLESVGIILEKWDLASSAIVFPYFSFEDSFRKRRYLKAENNSI